MPQTLKEYAMKSTMIPILVIFLGWVFVSGQEKQPLEIPKNFDHEVNMLANQVNGEPFHWAYANAQFVERLLDNGTEDDIALAEKIIPGLLSTQELRRESPHYGGFRWELETPLVNDLNAVQFVLDALIPALIRNEQKLSPHTANKVKQSIKLGLENIAKINVANPYTNIVLKDICNTSLGGELLADTTLAQRGYRRMADWMEFTDRSGSTYEYNSLPYTIVALDVLSKLERQVKHEPTRLRAKLMLARLSLSIGLHMHAPAKRWSGPHGRAYHNSYISAGGWYKLAAEELETVREWIGKGTIPSWIGELLTNEALPNDVVETVGRADGIYISTELTDTYSFGVASRNMANQENRFIAWQSNVFTSNFLRPGRRIPGALYTRYILDDEWLGSFAAAPGRPDDMLIPDKGHFQGVREGNRAIAMYVPNGLGALEHHKSAKSVIAIPRWDENLDGIWIADEKVTQFPAEIPPETTIVIASGAFLLAIKPLTISNLGTGPQLFIKKLDDRDHTLTIEMYNYQGPYKTFWELAWPGTFYQGQPQNGFYAEVAKRKDYRSPLHFSSVVNRGFLKEHIDPQKTYSGTEERKWSVEYSRGGKSLGLEVDLFDWSKPPRRWTHDGEIKLPMLESKWARQDTSGNIILQGAQLRTAKGSPSWLYVSPSKKTMVAAYHGPAKSSMTLSLPDKSSVHIPALEYGMIIWKEGKVEIDMLSNGGKPILKGCQLLKSE